MGYFTDSEKLNGKKEKRVLLSDGTYTLLTMHKEKIEKELGIKISNDKVLRLLLDKPLLVIYQPNKRRKKYTTVFGDEIEGRRI